MVFGKTAGGAYQTMNDDDDPSQVSSSSSDLPPPPSSSTNEDSSSSALGAGGGGGDVETGGATSTANQQQQQQQPAQNWNTDSEDDDKKMVEEEETEEVVVEEDDDESYEEEIVEDDEDDESEEEETYFTNETEEEEIAVDASGFPSAAPVVRRGDDEEPSTRSRDPEGTRPPSPPTYDEDYEQGTMMSSQKKAPSPPEEPEQAPVTTTKTTSSSRAGQEPLVRAPSGLKEKAEKVEEAKEDQFLSSIGGLVTMGILIFIALAAITIGTGLGIAKPFEDEPTLSPTMTPYPSAVPTFAPIPLGPEDEELLALWETVVGDVVYQEATPYYEAAQWMLFRDPSRVTQARRRYSFRHGRQLQNNADDYTEEELDYIQRYLLVFLWYATTNNGRQRWLSCNPLRPNYEAEDCIYQKAIRKLPNGEIQFEPIPWTRWLSGAEECDWAGVTCATTSDGRLAVSAIDLGGQGLVAPMEYIIEMMKLPEIKTLAFAYNELSGPLYPSLETLEILDLTDNQLEGPLILLGGLSSLTLEGNQFTGTLPTELFQFTTPLKHLNLGGNQLIGGIPPEASFALQLTSLDLHENRLEGTVPPELGQLPLRSLKLQGNSFNGPVPIDTININWLNTLEELWLFDNRLTGTIPVALSTTTRLLDLRLSQNNLVGGIPSDLSTLDRLYRLELASNQLSGELSISLSSQLTSLEVLDLSGNEFTGRIFLDGRLSRLQSLSLEFNQFTGIVPESLCSINSLESLSADCLPTTDPPNPCSCCTACCSRSTETCANADGSPIDPPATAPPALAPSGSPAGVEIVQQWARDTFGNDIDQSTGSAHSLASFWISQADSVGVTPEDATFFQRYVLAHFYFSTRSWKSCNPASTTSCLYQEFVEKDDADGTYVYVPVPATRWLAGVSECEWVGVTCTSVGTVTGIDLFGQEIKGELPVELTTLPGLNTVKLGYNSLSGTIPDEYGSMLSELAVFEVQGNADLVGPMPFAICDKSSLESLVADCDQVECSCCTVCCSNDGDCPPITI